MKKKPIMAKRELSELLKKQNLLEEMEYVRSINAREYEKLAEKIEIAIDKRDDIIKDASKKLSKLLDGIQEKEGFDPTTMYLSLARLMGSIAGHPAAFGMPDSLIKGSIDETAEVLKGSVYLVEIINVINGQNYEGSVN